MEAEQTNLKTSPEIGELAAAFVKAQAAMGNAKKSCDNPFFKSKYADLTEVLEVVKGPLNDNGLAVIQLPGMSGQGWAEVTTMLTHSSGQYIAATFRIPLAKNDSQGAGSGITYARRYALAALCGIAQEDDDGNGASTPQQKGGNRKQLFAQIAQGMNAKGITAEQMAAYTREQFGKNGAGALTNTELAAVVDWLDGHAV